LLFLPLRTKEKGVAKSKKQEKQNRHAGNFLLVGIGASAGGMTSLLTFFDNLPSDCNMSFVVIQHFDRMDHRFPRIGRRVMLLNARRIQEEGDRPALILLAFEDVTSRTTEEGQR
jgi:chemotaxis response regulator CheB